MKIIWQIRRNWTEGGYLGYFSTVPKRHPVKKGTLQRFSNRLFSRQQLQIVLISLPSEAQTVVLQREHIAVQDNFCPRLFQDFEHDSYFSWFLGGKNCLWVASLRKTACPCRNQNKCGDVWLGSWIAGKKDFCGCIDVYTREPSSYAPPDWPNSALFFSKNDTSVDLRGVWNSHGYPKNIPQPPRKVPQLIQKLAFYDARPLKYLSLNVSSNIKNNRK